MTRDPKVPTTPLPTFASKEALREKRVLDMAAQVDGLLRTQHRMGQHDTQPRKGCPECDSAETQGDETLTHIEGFLEVDHARGVVYFHAKASGTTRLRICRLGPIPQDFTLIDVTNKLGVNIYAPK